MGEAVEMVWTFRGALGGGVGMKIACRMWDVYICRQACETVIYV